MNVKETVLKTLAESGGQFFSGAALAKAVGVSRNAVWKAVKALEADGYVIESVTGKGYRLSESNNRLDEIIIGRGLETHYIGRKIVLLESVDSTNNYAKELASHGAESGTAVIAETQSSGKGRLGRTFVSPKGSGLYVTVIIRPKLDIADAQLITSCAAVAAAEAVESISGNEVGIKWVNDLYMNGRKICGILTEASLSLETTSLDYAVIGIGINVRSVKEAFEPELLERASSIEDETGFRADRNALCSELLNRLEVHLDRITEREFIPEYRRREILTGNMITAKIKGKPTVGKAVGIDENANLLMELENGNICSVNCGEANLCRIVRQGD